MASSASSGLSENFRRERGRGIPRKCKCGAGSIIRTSETYKNPGRLFYCCPNFSREDNAHLFKWTDVSMVEEMEKIESDVGKLQVDMENLEAEMVTNSYGKEIEAMKTIAQCCEKEIGELKVVVSCCEKELQDLRSFKKLIVCGVVMIVAYIFIFA